jgi:hypothetical protein
MACYGSRPASALDDRRPQRPRNLSELGLYVEAGDENRTRTVSLGSFTVSAFIRLGLRCGVSASDPEGPLFTGVNGTVMAQHPRRCCRRIACLA